MPCSSGISSGDYAYADAQRNKESIRNIIKTIDRLTYENDVLRECVLLLGERYGISDEATSPFTILEQQQIDHRQKDLNRLKNLLSSSYRSAQAGIPDYDRAWMRSAVEAATPTAPLEKQLRFDPNAY